MAGLLYFIEQTEPFREHRDLAKWGLTHAFENAPAATAAQDGLGWKGHFIYDPKTIGKFKAGYRPAEQTWDRETGPVRIGYWNEAPPKPHELARKAQLFGWMVELGDGQDWHVPVCRQIIGDECVTTLPRHLKLNDADEWEPGDIVARYAHIEHVIKPFIDDVLIQLEEHPDEEPTSKRNLVDDAITLLQANYRIGRREAALLGMFTDRQNEGMFVMTLASNAGKLLEWRRDKKKESERNGGVSSVGDTAGHPVTAPTTPK